MARIRTGVRGHLQTCCQVANLHAVDEQTTSTRRPLRVIIQQPALPAYRVPVFRELARRLGPDLEVIYGDARGGPPNVTPDGFTARFVHLREATIFGQRLLWHSPQITSAKRGLCDILVLSWNTRYVSLIPALLRARLAGVPTVLWGHGYSKLEAGWRSWGRRFVAQLATALLFYNRRAATMYIDAGFDPGRIFVAANSLDQEPIQAARRHWMDRPEDLAAFRREQGLGDGPVVLYVSRLTPKRRADLLVAAVGRLIKAHPTLTLVMIGGGDDTIGTLQQQARDLGIEDRVRFVGAIYDEMKLAPWFLSSDVVAFPFDMGLSLMHAFGYGKPVITSDRIESQGPEIEALRHGYNGLLYRHGDIEDLAKRLQELMADTALRAKMGEEAHRTILDTFNLSRMVEGFEAAIKYASRWQ
jgi:glycosyltransferase involved in cell wall biosynthesis